MKSGYPPKSLTIVPELPLESLGIKRGEQLIVTQRSGTSASRPGPPSIPAQPQAPVQPREEPESLFTSGSGRAANTSSGGPDSVQTDAGFLVHRVSYLSEMDAYNVKILNLFQIVPDDNSCLFSSVALVFEQDMSKASRIRQGALL